MNNSESERYSSLLKLNSWTRNINLELIEQARHLLAESSELLETSREIEDRSREIIEEIRKLRKYKAQATGNKLNTPDQAQSVRG